VPPEIADITERLERIERAVTEMQGLTAQEDGMTKRPSAWAVAGWPRWRC
jgi:hypothetical protein